MLAFRNDLGVDEFNFPKPIPLNITVKNILLPEEFTHKYEIVRNDVMMTNFIEKKSIQPIRLGIVNKGGQGERIYSIFGTAITLSAYGDGVGAKTGIYLVNDKLRRLAPRECARLTGFPDNFVISSNDNIAYKQFGNSVVVDVLQYIIEEIIKKKVFFNGYDRFTNCKGRI